MGKRIRNKGEKGKEAQFMSRNQALRRLQLSLNDFRKLCIFKGIYPRSNTAEVKYHKKDILFLSHEPLIPKLRTFKTYKRKLKAAIHQRDQSLVDEVKLRMPEYSIEHIIKERYPTFQDALKDLDDALNTVFAYAYLPALHSISPLLVHQCRHLSIFFLHYVIAARALRKTFISVKGYYFEAEIQGNPIVWVIPHKLMINVPYNLNYKLMNVFVKFHTTLLGFVNFQLYHSLNIFYPPKVLEDYVKNSNKDDEDQFDLVESLCMELKIKSDVITNEVQIDDFSEFEHQQDQELQQIESFKKLFEGLKFYLSRETPKEILAFVIRSFGGHVSWDGLVDETNKKVDPGKFYNESDVSITHQIVDRPSVSDQYMNRKYVQPQWIFDCVNKRSILETLNYHVGEKLPPHLSPFETKENSYESAIKMASEIKQSEELTTNEINERRSLAVKSMPKRRRRLYEQIKKAKKYETAAKRKMLLRRQNILKANNKN